MWRVDIIATVLIAPAVMDSPIAPCQSEFPILRNILRAWLFVPSQCQRFITSDACKWLIKCLNVISLFKEPHVSLQVSP